MKIGSHVGMSGKDMFLNSVKEAVSYNADTFMLYTGAPQNTHRKDISELNINAGLEYMKKNQIDEFIVHAPYIINLGNTIKSETFEIAVKFLQVELERTNAMKSKVLVLHPGAHVGAGESAAIDQISKGLNEILTKDTNVFIALETMSGKGSEVGKNFEELAMIYDKVKYNNKLRVCFDTCHVHDSGYDIVNDFDSVIDEFDKIIGKDQICVFHINDSKNVCGAKKDRHENIGYGNIGFKALNYIVHHKDFENVAKILETPYVNKEIAPYKKEIQMLREGKFEDWIGSL